MSGVQRLRCVLGIKKHNIPHTITLAMLVYNGMNGNANTYPSTNPTMPIFLGQIQALQAAQLEVKNHVAGAAAIRDTKRDIVVASLGTLMAGVQAQMDAAPEQAAALAKTAAMKVARTANYAKPILGVKVVAPPGSLLCRANGRTLRAAKGTKTRSVTFYWAYTLDGGKTYISALSTPVAQTTLTGLPLMTEVGVRVSIGDATGVGEWSPTVYAVVR